MPGPEPSWLSGVLNLGAAGVGLLTLWVMIQFCMYLMGQFTIALKERDAAMTKWISDQMADNRANRDLTQQLFSGFVAVQRESANALAGVVKEQAIQRENCQRQINDRQMPSYNSSHPSKRTGDP